MRPSSSRPRLSGTFLHTTRAVTAATGTLRRRTQRQLSQSVSMPPSRRPAAFPRPAEPMISPPASPALSAGSSAYVIPSVAGHMSAPPMPVSPRAPIS
jgi:hypothetical protein